jgi:hypothetical protein
MDDGTDGRDGRMDGKLHEKGPRRPLIYVMLHATGGGSVFSGTLSP